MWIHNRHRDWGPNFPAVNNDATFYEYHLGEPYAIVEYKHSEERSDRNEVNLAVVVREGQRANLPVFLVRFVPDETDPLYKILPLESLADLYGPPQEWLNELRFLEFLSLIRDRQMTELDRGMYRKLLRQRRKRQRDIEDRLGENGAG